jgi:hypothetical protein
MKAILLTASVVTVLTLIVVSNNASTVTADKLPVAGGALTQHYYEVEKIKLEIEMLECDKIFTVRPDFVIDKELKNANSRLKQMTELFQESTNNNLK